MTQIDNLVTSGKIVVMPSAVEAELRRIHHEAAQSFSENSEADTTRAKVTLANIVILSLSGGSLEPRTNISNLIGTLCLSFPSRFFVVGYHADVAKEAALNTAVSSRCVIADSGKKVCSEEIYISTSGQHVKVIQNLMRSLLVADVPVGLVVLCDPREPFLLRTSQDKPANDAQHVLHFKKLIASLSELSDFVVYDSSLFSNFAESFKVIDELKRASDKPTEKVIGRMFDPSFCINYGEVSFNDIAWQRNRRWMSLVAEQFDVKNAASLTEDITAFELECHVAPEKLAQGKVPADVLLFCAWICRAVKLSELVVTKLDSESIVLTAKIGSSDDAVQLSIKPSSQELQLDQSQAICSVRIDFSGEKGIRSLSIGYDGKTKTAKISKCIISKNAQGKEKSELLDRVVPFVAVSNENLILNRLFSKSANNSFDSILRMAARLSDKLLGFTSSKENPK